MSEDLAHAVSPPHSHTFPQVVSELVGLEGELAAARASQHYAGVLPMYEHTEQLLFWVSTTMQSAARCQNHWLFFSQVKGGGGGGGHGLGVNRGRAGEGDGGGGEGIQAHWLRGSSVHGGGVQSTAQRLAL